MELSHEMCNVMFLLTFSNNTIDNSNGLVIYDKATCTHFMFIALTYNILVHGINKLCGAHNMYSGSCSYVFAIRVTNPMKTTQSARS